MNTTFLTWFAVAAAVGGALLLFLGMPAGEQAEVAVVETTSVESVEQVTDYWEPVAPSYSSATSVTSHATAYQAQVVQPCSSCGMAQPGVLPVRVQSAQPQHGNACGSHQVAVVGQTAICGVCGALPRASSMPAHCAAYPCSACGATVPTSAVPIYMQYSGLASCEQRVPTPCGATPCSSLPARCTATCGTTCPLSQPGINRNMELCLEECTFVQLHTTLPHPICADVRFEWTTSKGSFLEPNVPDPIYYVPTTHFDAGEDVWVVVKITDSSGAQYTDQMKLHIINQR